MDELKFTPDPNHEIGTGHIIAVKPVTVDKLPEATAKTDPLDIQSVWKSCRSPPSGTDVLLRLR